MNITFNLNRFIFAHAACKYRWDNGYDELHCILMVFGPTRNYVIDPSIEITNDNFKEMYKHNSKRIAFITQIVINNIVYDCNLMFDENLQNMVVVDNFDKFKEYYLKIIEPSIKPMKQYMNAENKFTIKDFVDALEKSTI